MSLCSMQILTLLLVFLDPNYISLDFMLDNPNGRVADLVRQQELVELSEI